LQDILRQPAELRRVLDYWSREAKPEIEKAAAAIRSAKHVYLTGIGSSWHAALTVGPMFYHSAQPVYLLEASELVQFSEFPAGSVVIGISRSGRSIEIVQLVEKARAQGARIIGISNVADGTLARKADFPIVVPVAMDHAISVNTYTTLALAAGVLAKTAVSKSDWLYAEELLSAIDAAGAAISAWQKQIAESKWLAPGRTTYFLARGGSLGSSNEARLLWEEGVKFPATAMGTGVFRHGPQEIVREGMRFGIWLDAARMREQDLATASDLQKLGASVMLIGQGIPDRDADLIFQLPRIPGEWQFLIDCIPVQLAAEQLARMSGVDSDTFRLCSFVVEDEAGLLGGTTGPGAKS
jgi:glucosamine--fructose-6-phosphate aminotransferase (isomerizing)